MQLCMMVNIIFLYNSFKINRHISNTVTQVSPLDGSSIIEYDPSIGQYRQIFHARPIKDGNYISTKEFWKFAVKDVSDTVNGFYIIATESRVSRLTGIPRDGSYDSRQTGNEVHILEVQIPKTIQNSHYDNIDIDNDNGFSIFDHDDSSVSVFVPSNVILKPQLAHYYHISKRSSRRNMVPDSRRNLIWYEHPSDNTQHGLFYAYVDASNNKFGIARARSGNSQQAFIEADIDIRFNKALENHAGINFSIEDDILSGAITCRTTMTSGNVPTSAVTRFEKPLTT